jgi:putative sigma-54 modulation protein
LAKKKDLVATSLGTTIGSNLHHIQGGRMRIAMKGRNVPVGDELRERVNKKFAKVARQVSQHADMEVELIEERNPSIRQSQVVEVTLYLKGVTLRAREASESMAHSVNLAADDLARQVKRHRDKRRKRREAHRASPRLA